MTRPLPPLSREDERANPALPCQPSRMEDDSMETQLLLTGPTNEANLYELLEGTFDHNTRQIGYELDPLRNEDGAKAGQKVLTDHGMEDYLEPSMLGCFSAPWRCGQRGTRMRRRSSWRVEVNKLFGSQYHCTSGGEKCKSRKNNDHWTEDEMIDLVDGVSKSGIGKWSMVKEDYFSTSIRTSVHLKDKWRNLVRACKVRNTRRAKRTSKKKVISIQKATKLIVKRFGHWILAIEAKHLAQKNK